MTNALNRLLEDKPVLVADGAMGTTLFDLGLKNGACGELWCVDQPETVKDIHRGFVAAGSDLFLTNSFSSNYFRLKLHKIADRVRDLNVAAATLAREVADESDRPVVVAGSIGPSGEMLQPLGERSPLEVEEAFYEQAKALRDGGVDVAWVETMFSEEELAAAIRAVDRADLPIVATMTFDTAGRTMMGLTPEQSISRVKAHGSRPVAFGANCGVGPAQLLESVLGLKRGAENEDVIVAKGNCGIPSIGDDMKVHYDGTPEIMADYARMARSAGARIIGGCCGTTALHVRAMAQALAEPTADLSPGPPSYEAIETRFGPLKRTDRSSRRRVRASGPV